MQPGTQDFQRQEVIRIAEALTRAAFDINAPVQASVNGAIDELANLYLKSAGVTPAVPLSVYLYKFYDDVKSRYDANRKEKENA